MSENKVGTPWTGEYRGKFNYLDGLIAPFVLLSKSGEVVGFFFEADQAARARVCVNACDGIDSELLADDCIKKTREDRDELLKQRDELLEALKAARRAIGDHHAPEDCYATGPMTGNDYLDLVQCPACFAISKYDDAVSNSSGAPK